MPVSKGEIFSKRDVYIDYPFETVMYRWDYQSQKMYQKFYGSEENSNPIPHDNRLCNDALLGGDEISQQAYLEGKIG